MNKNKRPFVLDDVDYWKSMVDMIIGLLLVILLVMSLMVLGLLDKKDGKTEYTEVEPSPTATLTPSPSPTPTPTPSPTPYEVWGGGGAGHTATPSPTPSPTPTATPKVYDYDKSAVRVMVYDSESEQLLTEKSASFSLYQNDKKLTLYIRYPEVKGYSTFSTNDRGSFFLPEKLVPDAYTLKSVLLLDDYDLPDSIEFALEGDHDWDDPFIVRVDAVPCRNVIHLTVLDAETGEPVSGGQYLVTADETIVGGDGTIRYAFDETADTLYGAEDGTAESAELYLGTYRVSQSEPAFGYADTGESVSVTLKRRQSLNDTTEVQMKVSRTKVVLTVRDGAAYTRLQGVKFIVKSDSGLTECVTDANGEITLINLEKNAEYSVTQAEGYLDYQYDASPISFAVDEKGLIDGSASLNLSLTENRTICTFALRGKLLPIVASGQTMQLINAEGKTIKEWTSSAEAETISGIQPGTYTLNVSGKETEIIVENTSDTQAFELREWQTMEFAALGGAGLVVIAAFILVLILRKRKRG